MKKLLTFSAAVALAVTGLQPVHALEGGEEDPGNPRVVSLNGCTGFLYSPRIVLTAGHCDRASTALEPGLRTTWNLTNANSAKVIKFLQHPDYQYRQSGQVDLNDFGIAILDRPLAEVDEAKLVDEETLLAMAERGDKVLFTGYGLQSLEDREDSKVNPRAVLPRTAEFELIPRSEGLSRIAEYVARDSGLNSYPQDLVMVSQPLDGAQTCDGDSGSGYYLRDGSEFTYLGVTNWPLGIRNCYSTSPSDNWWQKDATVGIFPVYRGLDLIAEAEEFVAANPYEMKKPKNIVLPTFGSSLSSRVKARVKSYLDANPGVTKFICTSVRLRTTPRGESIANRARAKAVCEYAKSLDPTISTWYQSKLSTKRAAVGMQLVTIKFN